MGDDGNATLNALVNIDHLINKKPGPRGWCGAAISTKSSVDHIRACHMETADAH